MPSVHPQEKHAAPFLTAWCCAIFLAFAGLAPVGLAHQGTSHLAAATAGEPSATASAVEVQGRVGAIVVISRLTGQTTHHPVLELADGSRYLLKNPGSTAPTTGTTLAVTGRVDGRALFVQSTRQVTTPTTSQALRNAAPQRKALTGTLRMFHVDFADRPAEFGFSLVTDAGHQNIVELGTLLPQLENGMRATVSGTEDARGYVTVDTIEILAPPAKKGTGANAKFAGAPVALTTGYITLPIKFPNNAAAPFTYNADPASWPIATITDKVYGAAPSQSAAEYYKEVSFGAQLINGLVAHSGNAWLQANVARPTTCGTNAQLDAVLNTINSQGAALASAAGYNVGSYTGILYVIDALPCGWLGLGYIGWERAYAKGTAALSVVGHELGHNFGLYHAGRLNCGSSVIATSGCTVTEYGDPFDIMGNISSMHLAASQKLILGYILPSTTPTHSAGVQTYNLGPIELPGQSSYAVKIPTANSSRTYWVEFRRPIGFDSALSAGATGAQIRLARPFEWNNCSGCSTGTYDDTQLLDMTPGDSGSFGNNGFNNAALPVGQSYVDSTHGITIEIISASTSDLAVKVSKAGSLTPTTTTVASSLNPSTQGQSVSFTASVTGAAPTGTVAFAANGSPIAGCSSVALTGSGNTRTAACASSVLAVGVNSIVANYSGDAANTASGSSALSQTVKTPTTTTLISSLNPSTSGANVTFTATVNGSAPTGSVAFTSDGVGITGCSAVALTGSGDSRNAACTTNALAVGNRSIVAGYAGNSANGTSTSSALIQVVNTAPPGPTTTTLASSINPSVSGTNVTFTATVNGNAPTGNVAFTVDGAGIAGCSAVALVGSGNSRTAACLTNALAVGNRSIVGNYAGNATNAASTSSALVQVVNPAPTTTALVSSPNPSTSGTAVTFTATVNGNAPTGNIAFTVDGAGIAGCSAVALVGSGNSRTAACLTNALAVGNRSIVGNYAGNATNAASTSSALVQVVNPAPTTTALASSLNPSTAGTAVTFTATVNGNAPTGNVAFTVDGADIAGCSAVALVGSGNSRTAACLTNALAVGNRSVVANYAGNATNATSTSSTLAQVVNTPPPALTTIALASSVNPSNFGAIVAFTATVSGDSPTGPVAFTVDGAGIGGCSAVALTGSGDDRTATCMTNALGVGNRSVVANYAGNANNAASTSGTLAQVVNKAPATTSLVNSHSPSMFGTNVMFTATVSGNVPTGNVAFTADGIGIGGCSAVALTGTGNSRSATCNTNALAIGNHSIVADYAGNATNAASASGTLVQVVIPAPTTTTLTSSLNPSVFGTSVIFTATVNGLAPTGNVAFTVDGTGIAGCSAVALTGAGNSRSAACITNALAVGNRSVVANYAGSSTNAASVSGVLAQAVNSVTPPPPPSTFALTVTTAGTGIGTVTGSGIDCGSDCSENLISGTNVNLTATPTPNAPGGAYVFAGWGGSCSAFGTQSTCTLGMNAAKSATATFNYIGAGSAYSRAYVQTAYVAYYGRAADPGGQGFWAVQMDAAGQSLDAIIGPFGNSDEFNRRYGGLSFTQLVTMIYQQTLGRDPDQAGLDYYVGELQAGRKTLQTITLDILNGATTAPDSTTVANKLDVAQYYTDKVAAGCGYGTEQNAVNILAGVTAEVSTVIATKASIDAQCP